MRTVTLVADDPRPANLLRLFRLTWTTVETKADQSSTKTTVRYSVDRPSRRELLELKMNPNTRAWELKSVDIDPTVLDWQL